MLSDEDRRSYKCSNFISYRPKDTELACINLRKYWTVIANRRLKEPQAIVQFFLLINTTLLITNYIIFNHPGHRRNQDRICIYRDGNNGIYIMNTEAIEGK